MLQLYFSLQFSILDHSYSSVSFEDKIHLFFIYFTANTIYKCWKVISNLGYRSLGSLHT